MAVAYPALNRRQTGCNPHQALKRRTPAQSPRRRTASSTALSAEPPHGCRHDDTGYRSLGGWPGTRASANSRRRTFPGRREWTGRCCAAFASLRPHTLGSKALISPFGFPPFQMRSLPTTRGGGGDQELGRQQPDEPAHGATEGLQPRDPQHSFCGNKFSRLQLHKLESVFQRAQYPDVFTGKDSATYCKKPAAGESCRGQLSFTGNQMPILAFRIYKLSLEKLMFMEHSHGRWPRPIKELHLIFDIWGIVVLSHGLEFMKYDNHDGKSEHCNENGNEPQWPAKQNLQEYRLVHYLYSTVQANWYERECA
ncbi:PREDICTED: uncharacterized protein LOC103608523 [Galeopterus variegatus]|uniref:Uncharacterized protein LOC103608523 n=1 Tax=Galeopterus variegatus TaxID=482537 RepID=A0ABM0SE81_GALVR|nr:PREDICTED: uncharacterized protein LOC103608523 [Galeopterus variegatus]